MLLVCLSANVIEYCMREYCACAIQCGHAHISRSCTCSVSSYNFVKMKHRRDNKSQKITAFLFSAPPTKRASGVEDGGMPSSSSSEDRNQPTSSEQRERERHATASANMAKHKTGYNRTWKADHTWVFYTDGEGMYCKLCRKFDTKIVKTRLRSGTRSLVRPNARTY